MTAPSRVEGINRGTLAKGEQTTAAEMGLTGRTPTGKAKRPGAPGPSSMDMKHKTDQPPLSYAVNARRLGGLWGVVTGGHSGVMEKFSHLRGMLRKV